MDVTNKYQVLNEHINHSKGIKTVCVTTCLNFFNIPMDGYSYTSSKKNMQVYKDVLRRFGYSVRSRRSQFKVSKFPTMTELRSMLRKSEYGAENYFIVSGFQSKSAHLMVLNGNGDTIIDTAKGKKWRIRDISIVE